MHKKHLFLKGQTNNFMQPSMFFCQLIFWIRTEIRMLQCYIYNELYNQAQGFNPYDLLGNKVCLRMHSECSCFRKADSVHRGVKMLLNTIIHDIIVSPVLYINCFFIFWLFLCYCNLVLHRNIWVIWWQVSVSCAAFSLFWVYLFKVKAFQAVREATLWGILFYFYNFYFVWILRHV